MEKSALVSFFVLLAGTAFCSLVLSPGAYSQTDTQPGMILLANVGGPYSGEVGQEITFDASGSREAKNIEAYLWDYGDGEAGAGKLTTHRYMQAGFYNATLTVVGFKGEKNLDRTGVYIRNVELSVEAIISPGKVRYEYGDRITSIDAIVRFPNNTGVERASVSGILTGKEYRDLKFVDKGNGKYHADVQYPILKGEGSFIELSLKAVDQYGNTGAHVGKILISPTDLDFVVSVESPRDRIFAYGQDIRFKVRLINVMGKTLDNDSVNLYEGWSGRNYSLTKNGDEFYYTYQVPRDAEKEIAFLVNGKAVLDGKQYSVAEILVFGISGKLSVNYVEPRLGEYASNVSRIVLNITYPNGDPLRSDRLKAVINGEPTILNRNGALFAVNHSVKGGERILKVSVEDSAGNKGASELQLIPQDPEPLITPAQLAAGLCVLGIIALSFAAGVKYYLARRHKEDLKREYEELKQQREALKKLMKTIMHEYYTRKITSEDAKKRMLDYEKELLIEREKMRSVLHKLGIKMETEGKEELIEWIVEKLDQGEDPELLKEGLADTGIDPRIVDDIKKNLI